MNGSNRIPFQTLGQSGCRIEFPGATILIDPYLSNSVQLLDSGDLQRLVPVPVLPECADDVDWVFVSHDHIDHCDPHTLPKLARSSPQARFVGPAPVLKCIEEWGVDAARLVRVSDEWLTTGEKLRVKAVPAAHPEIVRDADGHLACVGFLFDYCGQLLYFAGDTFARQEIIDVLRNEGAIHTAILPVNEHNFFRGRRGILGNMSVREAFEFAKEIEATQVVAVHWDMFAANAVTPDEIRVIHRAMNPGFSLLLRPASLTMGSSRASIVIRTLNEARHLEALLQGIAMQQTEGFDHEVVLVDSGSTDGTLEIAERYGCRILHIAREEFSFGRSLNIGCEAATGDILVMTSGHCVPVDEHWLQRLCGPIFDGSAEYTYGRQHGGAESHFSECRIFAKYYPAESKIPQEGFFCNNANSALLRDAWLRHRFDEELTGLEDMELAQRLLRDGGKIAYVSDAGVYHYHNESWPQIRRRFEREAIALQRIMPQVHVSIPDTLRYVFNSVWKDWKSARREGRHRDGLLFEIIRYRWNQYIGSWKGNHEHRKLSHADKEKYFFPH